MVVKHEKSAEDIRESLVRLLDFFSGSEAHRTDAFILSRMESELIRMESQLKMYGGYKGGRDVQNRIGARAPGAPVVDPGA
jgi:hypothetical protein